jgi:hypothetical protein
MTQTFTTGVLQRFTSPGLPTPDVGAIGTSVDRFFVWNFEFGSLEFI